MILCKRVLTLFTRLTEQYNTANARFSVAVMKIYAWLFNCMGAK